jgi:hypothetical protein
MTIHPKDELEDEQHQKKLDADIERRDNERIEKLLNKDVMSNKLELKIAEINSDSAPASEIHPNKQLYQLTEDACLQFNEWKDHEAWEIQFREQQSFSPKELFNYFINNVYKP